MRKHRMIHAVIIAICVVLVWRGIWGAMDMYFLPGAPLLSHILSVVIGISILLIVDNFDLQELE
ncbi:MAG: hypothetical protein PHO92_01230 [Candidatus Peribacteraceae bacterium]|nr:hypothetical protein [Candidatus Peribacteraceae bacterium]